MNELTSTVAAVTRLLMFYERFVEVSPKQAVEWLETNRLTLTVLKDTIKRLRADLVDNLSDAEQTALAIVNRLEVA